MGLANAVLTAAQKAAGATAVVGSLDGVSLARRQYGHIRPDLPANYLDYPLSAGQRYGQVATNCRVVNSKSGTNKGFCCRSHHRARGALTEVAVKVPNWYVDRSGIKGEMGNDSTVLCGGSIEYPAGTFTRMTFNGLLRAAINPNVENISDFVSISIPDNAEFWIGLYFIASTGIVFFNAGTGQVSANGEKCIVGAAATADYSATVGGGSMSTQAFGFWPLAIIGRTTNIAVGIDGDSIAEGVGDTADSTDAVGSVARSIVGTCAYINTAQSGDRLELMNYGATKRLQQFAYVRNVVCEAAVNDIGSGRTLAQIKADMITRWLACGVWLPVGGRVFQTTITPSTTSTDLWVTTANQTAATNFSTAGNGTRELLNDWLRDGAPMSGGAAAAIGAVGALRAGSAGHPIHAVFELADVFESARNSGKWKVDGTANKYTADGIHPTAFANAAIVSSGAINTALFV